MERISRITLGNFPGFVSSRECPRSLEKMKNEHLLFPALLNKTMLRNDPQSEGKLRRHLLNHYIFPSFPSFLPCVATSPAAADGPMGMIFGMWLGHGGRMLIFAKSGS